MGLMSSRPNAVVLDEVWAPFRERLAAADTVDDVIAVYLDYMQELRRIIRGRCAGGNRYARRACAARERMIDSAVRKMKRAHKSARRVDDIAEAFDAELHGELSQIFGG